MGLKGNIENIFDGDYIGLYRVEAEENPSSVIF